MPPTLGLNPIQPQKLAGRRIEPTTCVPSAAGTMPQATAAAEPLLDPPGVRSRSHGLRVPRGSVAANSVVTTFPRITAPASRKAATLAASRPVRQPTNSGEPCPVGMSAVSMMSLMPSGIPSIGDKGRPARQRAAERSAAVPAAAISWQTKAPTRSDASRRARQRPRSSRGVSRPDAKSTVAEKNDVACGIVIAALLERVGGLRTPDSYPQIGPYPGMIGRPQRGIVGARPVEADLTCEDLDTVGNPDVVDAAIHPRPVRVGNLAIPAGERGEGSRRGLGRVKPGGHQPGRSGIEAGIEVAAHDRRRAVRAVVDPCH